jgi:hypothetical protein
MTLVVESLLEQFMPRFATRSQHAIEVHASAQAVFTAVEAVSAKEVRFLRELEFIRALPRLAATGRLDVPAFDAPLMLNFTRGAALLGARPPEEVLAGAIGRFWRLTGNEPVVFGSPEEFLTFAEPGFVKAVVGFRVDSRERSEGARFTARTRPRSPPSHSLGSARAPDRRARRGPERRRRQARSLSCARSIHCCCSSARTTSISTSCETASRSAIRSIRSRALSLTCATRSVMARITA